MKTFKGFDVTTKKFIESERKRLAQVITESATCASSQATEPTPFIPSKTNICHYGGNCAWLSIVGAKVLSAIGYPAKVQAGSFGMSTLQHLEDDDGKSPNYYGFCHTDPLTFNREYHAWIVAGKDLIDFGMKKIVTTARAKALYTRKDLNDFLWIPRKDLVKKRLNYEHDHMFCESLLHEFRTESDLINAAVSHALQKLSTAV